MSKLLDFTKKKGVEKLTPKQKTTVAGGWTNFVSYSNIPPKQKIGWWKPKG